MKATILTFHRINPVRDKLWDPVDPALFEKVMKFISRKYEVLSLNEICLEQPGSKKPLLAITFDDGFKDYAEYALPILKKYNFHSTMFVVTDCVENNLPTWTYIMDYLFFHTKILTLPAFDYGIDGIPFSVNHWQSKADQLEYSRKIKKSLKKLNSIKRKEILAFFTSNFNDVNVPGNLMLSWDDLRSLKNEKVDIGSHTVSHPPLTTIRDSDDLEYEIKISGDIIKKELGFFPTAISYPVGSYDDKVKAATKLAGYKMGLTVDQKKYNPLQYDMFAIPRIEVYNESFFRSKMKIYGIESAIRSKIGI